MLDSQGNLIFLSNAQFGEWSSTSSLVSIKISGDLILGKEAGEGNIVSNGTISALSLISSGSITGLEMSSSNISTSFLSSQNIFVTEMLNASSISCSKFTGDSLSVNSLSTSTASISINSPVTTNSPITSSTTIKAPMFTATEVDTDLISSSTTGVTGVNNNLNVNGIVSLGTINLISTYNSDGTTTNIPNTWVGEFASLSMSVWGNNNALHLGGVGNPSTSGSDRFVALFDHVYIGSNLYVNVRVYIFFKRKFKFLIFFSKIKRERFKPQ